MHKIVLMILLLVYQARKYRILHNLSREPGDGLVLFPRQDARFAHASMTILQTVFVLEFISHPFRDAGAVQRLIVSLALFLTVDAVFFLKLKNTRLHYDQTGVRIQNMIGSRKDITWGEILEVRSSAVGLRQSRYCILKTTKGTVRLNERSPGLARFRRVLEEKV